MNEIPGLEVLFREQKRMANKLTTEELKALSRFLRKRLFEDNHSLLFKLSALESVHEISTKDFEKQVYKLKKELEQKDSMLTFYRRTSGNLQGVYYNREARSEKEIQELKTDVVERNNELDEMKKELVFLREIFSENHKLIQNQSAQIEELNKTNAYLSSKVTASRATEVKIVELEKDILKLKCKIDSKENEIGKLKTEMVTLERHIQDNHDQKKLQDAVVREMDLELEKQHQITMEKCEEIIRLKSDLVKQRAKTKQIEDQLLSYGRTFSRRSSSVSTAVSVPSHAPFLDVKTHRIHDSTRTGKYLSQTNKTSKSQVYYCKLRVLVFSLCTKIVRRSMDVCEGVYALLQQDIKHMEATRQNLYGNYETKSNLESMLLRRGAVMHSLKTLIDTYPKHIKFLKDEGESLRKLFSHVEQPVGNDRQNFQQASNTLSATLKSLFHTHSPIAESDPLQTSGSIKIEQSLLPDSFEDRYTELCYCLHTFFRLSDSSSKGQSYSTKTTYGNKLSHRGHQGHSSRKLSPNIPVVSNAFYDRFARRVSRYQSL